jgi:hypothetical protein
MCFGGLVIVKFGMIKSGLVVDVFLWVWKEIKEKGG